MPITNIYLLSMRVLFSAFAFVVTVFFVIASTFKAYNNVSASFPVPGPIWEYSLIYGSAFIGVFTIPMIILYLNTNIHGVIINTVIFFVAVFFVPASYAYFYDSLSCFDREMFEYQTEFYASFAAYSTVGFGDIEFSQECRPIIVGQSILGIIVAGTLISIFVTSLVNR